MKRLIVLCLLLAGCAQRDELSTEPIALTYAQTEASKTDALTVGDEVTVCASVDGTQNYFLNGSRWSVGSDGKTLVPPAPVFYPDAKQVVAFYAYFGSQNIPTDQSTPAALKQADLCWASASSTPSNAPVPLTFSHVFARLTVACSQPTSKILIPSAFSGGTLDIRTGIFTNSTKSDVFTTQNELIVPAQTLNRLIITSNGVDYVFDGSIALESGKTTTVNLTLNTATHTASLAGSSVAAWTTAAQSGTPAEGVSNTLSLQWVPAPPQAAAVDKIVLTLNDETNGTASDYTVSSGIVWRNGAFEVPFASAVLHYPYTIQNVATYQGATPLLSASVFMGPTVYKSGIYAVGVLRNPINPPLPSDYVKIGNLYWAKGNLVATSSAANKINGCKVGNQYDGGLYFQFGSLIGWKGGALANGGTGVGYNPYLGENVQWWGNATAYSWANDAMVWPTAMVGYPTSWPQATSGTAHQWYFSGSGVTSGTINVMSPEKGVGDPCTYYLGNNWRLPTAAEYVALYDNASADDSPYPANWSWTTVPYNGALRTGNTIYFPASGIRHFNTGAFRMVTADAFEWSSSVSSFANCGHAMSAYSNGYDKGISTQYNHTRAFAFPARCVSSAP